MICALDGSNMLTVLRRLCGHVSAAPSGVFRHSRSRIRPPISPPPCRNVRLEASAANFSGIQPLSQTDLGQIDAGAGRGDSLPPREHQAEQEGSHLRSILVACAATYTFQRRSCASLLEVRMRRSVIVLAGLAVISIAAESTLNGQQQSSSLTVNATVSKNCTITTAPVNFGAYDPVAANATAPLDGIGTITVTCTKGAGVTLALNPGSNAQGTTRRMSQGGTAH